MTKDTKPDVWFPLVVGDYLKDTSRLTTEQHGAYLLLLMDYWTSGPLPNDDVALASIVKLDSRRWRLHRPTILKFFKLKDGVWRQKRADAELERWTEKKRLWTERASAGGKARAAKSSALSTIQAAKSGQKTQLESCTSSSSGEVEDHRGSSTLSGREASEARHEGASELRVIEGGLSELAAWQKSHDEASIDYAHFSESDPDFASEIAEFLEVALAKITELSRAAA